MVISGNSGLGAPRVRRARGPGPVAAAPHRPSSRARASSGRSSGRATGLRRQRQRGVKRPPRMKLGMNWRPSASAMAPRSHKGASQGAPRRGCSNGGRCLGQGRSSQGSPRQDGRVPGPVSSCRRFGSLGPSSKKRPKAQTLTLVANNGGRIFYRWLSAASFVWENNNLRFEDKNKTVGQKMPHWAWVSSDCPARAGGRGIG